jgi:hypothetical protein
MLQVAMFPGYPAGDVRLEMIERELYIDEIKANQRCIGPLARCINGPHANLYGSSEEISQNYMMDIPHNRDPEPA